MIDFDKFYLVVRKHVPRCVSVPVYEIPSRICKHETIRIDEFVSDRTGYLHALEFDGTCYYRVACTNDKAPDGLKNLAYVVAGVRFSDIKTSVHPLKAARIVNSMMNKQYRDFVLSKRNIA